jgi:hypothetical protein
MRRGKPRCEVTTPGALPQGLERYAGTRVTHQGSDLAQLPRFSDPIAEE